VVNFGTKPLPLDDGVDVLLASAPLDGRSVPQDTAVWMMYKEFDSE
jgi:alpha-glucosidase